MPTQRRVEVVPYDRGWREAAEAEIRRIEGALDGVLIRVHHIGSTSIPGIYAKPILDLIPVVGSLEALDAKVSAMEALDYEAMGEFGIAGRRFYRRDDADGQRTHNLHAFVLGSPQIDRHVAFRDYMIAHPGDALAYSELKQGLAARHPTDIDAYMAGKDAFIKDVEARALVWRASR